MPRYILNINNERKEVEVESNTPLLYVLRNNLKLNGPKFGCGLSQCGSCSILYNGKSALSCAIPISSVGQAEITTLSGLVKEDGTLHKVQQAFINEQAAQCGYCVNGMIISAVSLLSSNPNPNESEIKEALNINLCRCGTHTRVIKAIQTAANLKQK